MAVDDLTAPLGRRRRHRAIKLPVPQIMAGALAAFLGLFVLWAVVADDPYGGEPMAVVSANLRLPAKTSGISPSRQGAVPTEKPHDAQRMSSTPGATPEAPANTTTVTILSIDTGPLPAPGSPCYSPCIRHRRKRR